MRGKLKGVGRTAQMCANISEALKEKEHVQETKRQKLRGPGRN